MNIFKTNSYKKYKELEKELEEFKCKLEGMYFSLCDEIKEEYKIDNRNKLKISKELDEVYGQLNYSLALSILLKKIPLRVKLLNKISVCGYGQTSNDTIKIDFTFSSFDGNVFSKEFSINEIKKYNI